MQQPNHETIIREHKTLAIDSVYKIKQIKSAHKDYETKDRII